MVDAILAARRGAAADRPWHLVYMPLLGALAAAGLAPLGWWWLTLPALAILTAAIASAERPRRAAWLGWLAGLGYFTASLFWIVNPFLVEPERDGWMAPFALALMAGGMALFWALAAGLGAWTGGGDRRRRAWGFAVALAASGLLRTYVLTGFPWALIGHVWIGFWPDQIAALGGAVLLSLMTTLAAAAPVALGPLRGLALGGAMIGAAAGWGGWRLDQPVAPRAKPINVRLAQPDAAQALKWRADYAVRFFDRLLKETAQPPAAGAPSPDLVIWPETAVPFLLNRPGAGLQMIAKAGGGVPVALGIQRSKGRRYFNSLAVIGPDAKVLDVYDKHHLVPFGEYVPLGDLFYRLTGIAAFAPSQGGGFTPGKGAAVLDLGRLGKVLPLICYEAIFPQDVNAAPERADWMVQITDDAWFGTISGPYQHLAQARLRAVEQGLPLMRVANTGVSAVIDAKGRVLQSLPMLAQGVIDAAVPPSLAPTPYSRTGDWPIALLLAALISGLALGRRRAGH